jgi:hypothetical protein
MLDNLPVGYLSRVAYNIAGQQHSHRTHSCLRRSQIDGEVRSDRMKYVRSNFCRYIHLQVLVEMINQHALPFAALHIGNPIYGVVRATTSQAQPHEPRRQFCDAFYVYGGEEAPAQYPI